MNRNDQNFLIEKIRTQYTEKEHTALDELKALDARVKRPANVLAYVLGSLGTVIMGAGMSLVMTDLAVKLGIEGGMPIGIVTGIIGMLIAIVNYPIYKKHLAARREKYADEIIALSDKIIKE